MIAATPTSPSPSHIPLLLTVAPSFHIASHDDSDLDHPEEESPTNASKMDLTSEVSSVDDSLLCEEDANLEESELDDETYSFLLSSDFTVA